MTQYQQQMPASRRGIGILGGFRRVGRWTVSSSFTAFTFLGGGLIDLREAVFTDRTVTIRSTALLGGVTVIVPANATVEVRGVGFMGGFDQSASGQGAPDAPVIVLSGFAFWGGVKVRRESVH